MYGLFRAVLQLMYLVYLSVIRLSLSLMIKVRALYVSSCCNMLMGKSVIIDSEVLPSSST